MNILNTYRTIYLLGSYSNPPGNKTKNKNVHKYTLIGIFSFLVKNIYTGPTLITIP